VPKSNLKKLKKTFPKKGKRSEIKRKFQTLIFKTMLENYKMKSIITELKQNFTFSNQE